MGWRSTARATSRSAMSASARYGCSAGSAGRSLRSRPAPATPRPMPPMAGKTAAPSSSPRARPGRSCKPGSRPPACRSIRIDEQPSSIQPVLFAGEGAKVAIAELDAVSGEETAHLAGNGAIAIPTDVTEPDSLARAIRGAVGHFGRLDILHNNAGGSTARDDTAVDAPLDEFWRAIKLDLYGTFLGCRFGIPELVKAGGGS